MNACLMGKKKGRLRTYIVEMSHIFLITNTAILRLLKRPDGNNKANLQTQINVSHIKCSILNNVLRKFLFISFFFAEEK